MFLGTVQHSVEQKSNLHALFGSHSFNHDYILYLAAYLFHGVNQPLNYCCALFYVVYCALIPAIQSTQAVPLASHGYPCPFPSPVHQNALNVAVLYCAALYSAMSK
jgi:hypothetical protein